MEIKSFPLLTKISRTENQKVSNPRRTTNRKKKQPIFHEDSTLLSLKIEKRRHTVYTVSLRSKCFSDGSLDRSSSPRSTGWHRDSLSNLENGGCENSGFNYRIEHRHTSTDIFPPPRLANLLHRSSSLANPLATPSGVYFEGLLRFTFLHNRNGLEMCGEAKKPHSLTLNIRFEGWWRGIRSFLSSIDLPELFGKGLLSDFLPDNVRWDGLNFCTVSDLLDSGFGYVSKVVSLLEGWLERGDH